MTRRPGDDEVSLLKERARVQRRRDLEIIADRKVQLETVLMVLDAQIAAARQRSATPTLPRFKRARQAQLKAGVTRTATFPFRPRPVESKT